MGSGKSQVSNFPLAHFHSKRIDYVEELFEIRMQEHQLEAEKVSIKERSTWELAVMVTYITTAIYILMH